MNEIELQILDFYYYSAENLIVKLLDGNSYKMKRDMNHPFPYKLKIVDGRTYFNYILGTFTFQ